MYRDREKLKFTGKQHVKATLSRFPKFSLFTFFPPKKLFDNAKIPPVKIVTIKITNKHTSKFGWQLLLYLA